MFEAQGSFRRNLVLGETNTTGRVRGARSSQRWDECPFFLPVKLWCYWAAIEVLVRNKRKVQGLSTKFGHQRKQWHSCTSPFRMRMTWFYHRMWRSFFNGLIKTVSCFWFQMIFSVTGLKLRSLSVLVSRTENKNKERERPTTPRKVAVQNSKLLSFLWQNYLRKTTWWLSRHNVPAKKEGKYKIRVEFPGVA